MCPVSVPFLVICRIQRTVVPELHTMSLYSSAQINTRHWTQSRTNSFQFVLPFIIIIIIMFLQLENCGILVRNPSIFGSARFYDKCEVFRKFLREMLTASSPAAVSTDDPSVDPLWRLKSLQRTWNHNFIHYVGYTYFLKRVQAAISTEAFTAATLWSSS